MAAARIPQLAGVALPGGEYHISGDENRRLCAALCTAPAANGSAHAIYAYIATQAGMGLGVEGLLALCEFDAADGPLLGSSSTRHLTPLRTGETYRVSGKILGLTRKRSRKLGVIDVLEYRLAMSRASGERVVEVTNTWILPRGQPDA